MAVLFYADHKGVVQVVAAGILPDSECIRAMEHQQYVGKIIDRDCRLILSVVDA